MSRTKELFMQTRQHEQMQKDEDADYLYQQFLEEQYLQHFEKEKSNINQNPKNNEQFKSSK